MANAQENKDINDLKTDVAVIKATQISYVNDFKDFKVEVKANQQDIIEKMDKFAFTPLTMFTELKTDFEKFKTDVETNYKKKADGQNVRNIGYTVAASIIVIVLSAFVNFIINGGLRNVQ